MYYDIQGILIGKYDVNLQVNLHYPTGCSSKITDFIKKHEKNILPYLK